MLTMTQAQGVGGGAENQPFGLEPKWLCSSSVWIIITNDYDYKLSLRIGSCNYNKFETNKRSSVQASYCYD